MTTQRRFFTRPRLWGILGGVTLAVARLFTPAGMGVAQAATTTCTPNGAAQDCTVTFSASGAPESWTVPPGVTSATFDLYGAQGGGSNGGLGGRVTATLAVTPGASYQVRVGVWGSGTVLPAGYNGGGARGGGGSGAGQVGGGASDVRGGAFGLADRLLVAGGGGGIDSVLNGGGAGGYPSGGAGGGGAIGGGGGTQTAGGAGGVGQANGSAGSLGQGGAAGNLTGPGTLGGGGGGGGYYGGGGGGSLNGDAGSGGGGSSYATPAATNVSFQTGVRSQNGQVIISYTLADTTAPVANPTQSPAAAPSGWNNSNVTVTWNWSDPTTSSGPVSGIDLANCTTSSVSSGSGTINLTATCKDKAGNTGTATYSVRIDPTAPTANPSQSPAANGAGWNNTDVTVNWNWTFTGASIDTANCTNSLTSSGEGTLTLSATCKDVALNQRTVPYTVKVDKTAPQVGVTGVAPGASYLVGSVPTANCSTSDALSGVATQATVSLSGGNPDGSGSFTATCSVATDIAGNSAAPVSVSYSVSLPPTPTLIPTDTPVPPTATPIPTDTPVPPTATPVPTDTPVPPTATLVPTNTPVPPTATATSTPSPSPSPSPTPTAGPADACLTTGLLDNFNRANGGVGGNWTGLTDQSFYKIANNKVDVQLGGPIVWKPTAFGVNQAAFVTLSTVDGNGPAQGVLLKVQTGTIPNAGAISVVYDSVAKAVRVSTLRLNTPTWTLYANKVATFANGDRLGGCVSASGTVRIYKNSTLVTTVTLNTADQSFFNTKGGRIGLWTVVAPNAFFDDFGGG